MEELASPGEVGHQEEQRGEEETGEPLCCDSRVAQVLLTAVVLQDIGT